MSTTTVGHTRGGDVRALKYLEFQNKLRELGLLIFNLTAQSLESLESLIVLIIGYI